MNNPNITSAVSATHPFETRVRKTEIRFHMAIFFISSISYKERIVFLANHGAGCIKRA